MNNMKNHIISALLAIATLICIGCESDPNASRRELITASMDLGKAVYENAIMQAERENKHDDNEHVKRLFEKKRDSITATVFGN